MNSSAEHILIFNVHQHLHGEIPQPGIQSGYRRLPPSYLFNILVVFSVAVVTPHDLSGKVELMSACCSGDLVPAPHPPVVPAVGDVAPI